MRRRRRRQRWRWRRRYGTYVVSDGFRTGKTRRKKKYIMYKCRKRKRGERKKKPIGGAAGGTGPGPRR